MLAQIQSDPLVVKSFVTFIAIVAVGMGIFYLFATVDQASAALRRKRERYRNAIRSRASASEENVRRQLNKPTFENRLVQFADGKSRENEPESKMPYWEADGLELKHVAPRPIEWVRMLLMRIKKRLIKEK